MCGVLFWRVPSIFSLSCSVAARAHFTPLRPRSSSSCRSLSPSPPLCTNSRSTGAAARSTTLTWEEKLIGLHVKKKVFLIDICLLHNSWLRTSTRSFPGILNSRNTKHTVIIHRFDFNKLLFPLTHNLGGDRNAKMSKYFKLVGFNWNIYREKYSDITRAVTNSQLVCNKNPNTI